MIIVETVDEGTRERRYSDKDVMIKQIETGNLYEDAVDVIPCRYTYEETDIAIEHPEESVEENANHTIPPFVDIPTIPNI